MKVNRICIALSAAALVGLSSTAMADTFQAKYTGGTSLGVGVEMKFNLNGAGYKNTFAQQMNFSFQGAPSSLGTSQMTFCTELTQYVNGNWQTYELVSVADAPKPGPPLGMGADKAQAIYHLYDFAAGQQFGTDNFFAAAFQMMIWEIVYDASFDANGIVAGSLDVASGNLQMQRRGNTTSDNWNDVLTVFNSMKNHFAALTSGGLDFGWGDVGANGLRGMSSDGYQDQLVMIPLPAPVFIGLAGLALIPVLRRRKQS